MRGDRGAHGNLAEWAGRLHFCRSLLPSVVVCLFCGPLRVTRARTLEAGGVYLGDSPDVSPDSTLEDDPRRGFGAAGLDVDEVEAAPGGGRSEERRVGKECR